MMYLYLPRLVSDQYREVAETAMALGRVREEVTRALDMLEGSWMDEMLGRDRSEFVQKRRLEQIGLDKGDLLTYLLTYRLTDLALPDYTVTYGRVLNYL